MAEGRGAHSNARACPAACNASHAWLPELVERIASFLKPNVIACTLRLVNKATAAQFGGRKHTAVRLSEDVPHHAFAHRWSAPGATRSLTFEDRRQLVRLTAVSGSARNLQVAITAAGGPLVAKVSGALEAAAVAGRLEACQLLVKQRHHVTRSIVALAAQAGHIELAEWLLVHVPVDREPLPHVEIWNGSIVGCALESCALADCQRLRSSWNDELSDLQYRRLLKAAASSMTADWQAKVDWVSSQVTPRISSYYLRAAMESACASAATCPDALDRLRWLRGRGYPFGGALRSAASSGHTAAMEYLLTEGVEAEEGDAVVAARAGQLEALRLLHAHGCPMDPAVIVERAVDTGRLPVVVWAVETLGYAVAGRVWPMRRAAHTGRVEVMSWLLQRGCLLAQEVLLAAAKSGRKAAVEWSLEHGCALTADALTAAAKSGCKEAVKWLLERDCPLTADALTAAAKSGCKEAVEWLVERDCPLTADALTATAESGCTQTLRLLVEHGCALTADAITAAAESGCEEALEYLVERGCPMPVNGDPYIKASNGRDPLTLRCLRRLGCPWGPDGRVFAACAMVSHLRLLMRCLQELGCPAGSPAPVSPKEAAFMES